GADSSSIDTELARRLGYSAVIDIMDVNALPEYLEKEDARGKMHELDAELKPKFEYLNDISLISSSHGISLRPAVKLKIEVDTLPYETNANIFDRAHLDYKMIVGRKSLQKFLIDPMKKSLK
ncbi:MAG: hypothetical protein ACMG57_04560, partial [Candidatus Dojkabacteria bacterium]